MHILVLGGTSFVGRHVVDAALARDHRVSLFNRGVTNPGLFPQCEHLVGDRDAGELESLSVGEWDAVVDVNGYLPSIVRQSTAMLSGRIDRYLFISTIGVYVMPSATPIDESSPRQPPLDDGSPMTLETYGPLKVACEDVVTDAFGPAATIVRPGQVVGPHDPTDRFTCWVRRVAQGGTMVGPGRAEQRVQFVHARDQGDFVVTLIEQKTSGVFNSVGPNEPLTLGGMLAACAEAANVDLDVVWVDDDRLAEHRVSLPMYHPSSRGGDGMLRIPLAHASAAGLHSRPVVDTAADTLAWDRTRDPSSFSTTARWLDPSTEADILRDARAT